MPRYCPAAHSPPAWDRPTVRPRSRAGSRVLAFSPTQRRASPSPTRQHHRRRRPNAPGLIFAPAHQPCIAAKTTDPTAGDLRYQLSFGQTARECAVQGATMIVKVGVQGRVILGPMGGPGKVEVPLRYAV